MNAIKTHTFLLLLLTLVSCSESKTPPQKLEEETVVPPKKHEQTASNDSVIRCTGTIAVPPESEVSIHAPIGALISSIHVMEGVIVKKGEPLAKLEHTSVIRIQEEYLTAKSEFEFAQKEHDRKTVLFQKSVIPDKEYDQSGRDYQLASAHFQSLKKQIRFLGLSLPSLNEGQIQDELTIRSPINGSVTHIAVKNGRFAAQDTELFTLIDDTHKHVHLKVFTADALRLKEGQKIRLKTADSDKVYEAEVYLIGKAIDPNSNTVAIHGHLLNDTSELITGTFVFAEIQLSEAP